MVQENENVRELQVGVYDAPLEQRQPILKINLLNDNVAVFGAKQSGKTTFVQNILVRLHEIIDPNVLEEEIYILDLNSTIGDYGTLPCVCCCFDDSNEEDVKTLFKTVEDKLKRNNELLRLAKRNSITQFLTDPPACIEERPKHITIIVENLNAFLAEERFTLYHEMLLKFCRDGVSKGLTVIFTANGVSGGVSRYLSNMETILAFGMPSDQEIEVFNEKPPQILRVPGRGIVKKSSGLFEFQGFLPFESDKNELSPFIQSTVDRIGPEHIPTKLISFTKVLTVENFAENTYTSTSYGQAMDRSDGIVLGLDYYYHTPVSLIPSESRSIGIYGKKSFGKTNLLNLLVGNLLLRENDRISTVVMFDDGRRELDGLFSYINETMRGIQVYQFFDRMNFADFIGKFYREIENSIAPSTVSLPTSAYSDPTFQTEETAGSLADAAGHAQSYTEDADDDPLGGDIAAENTGTFEHTARVIDSSSQRDKTEPELETQDTAGTDDPDAGSGGTLFIIQSKSMYQKAMDGLENMLQMLINEAEQNDLMFIFSDVKKHPEADMESIIGTSFSKAFLLNDIAEFVSDKGIRTVFGEFDAKELKLEYAKCELGDGYYFDVERDDLIKMKMLKSPFKIKEKGNKR